MLNYIATNASSIVYLQNAPKLLRLGLRTLDHARGAYSDPDTLDVSIYVVGNGKNGFEICEFTGRVGGLPVSDLTGNNLAYFVCNYQKFSIVE